MSGARGEILMPGTPCAAAPALVLTAPISFWGGVDPATGLIADVRHPQHGLCVSHHALFLPGTIGSSSASAVLLELVHRGIAPAGLIMHEPDAILLMGLVVAREMGWQTPIAVKLGRDGFMGFAGRQVAVLADGLIEATG